MIIYKTINNVNGKFYIGKDKHDNPKYIGSGKILWKAIAKYGRSNFSKEIVEHCESIEHLNKREIFWINELNSRNRDIGYNIAKGGVGGDTISMNTDKHIGIEKRLKTIAVHPEKFHNGYVKRSKNLAMNPHIMSDSAKRGAATKKLNPVKYEETKKKHRETVKLNPEPTILGYAKMQETKKLNPRSDEQLIFTKEKQSNSKSHYFLIDNIKYKGIVKNITHTCMYS